MRPRIIATQGSQCYLVLVAEDRARVLDLEARRYFPAFNLQSILARGYWQAYRGSQRVLRDLIKRVNA